MRTKRKASPATFSVNNDELHNTETAIVVASSSYSTAVTAAVPFKVPEHWIVEKRRRVNGVTAGLVDKYYHEPETGRKFRSLRSIEEYLRGSERKPPAVKLLGYEKKEEFPKKRKIPTVKSPTVKGYSSPRRRYISSKFPVGWLVEECVRLSGVSAGKVDRYYIEPETGQRFRSLKSIEEFLAESQNNTPALKMLPFDEKEKLFEKRTSISVPGTKATPYNLPEGWVVEEYVGTSGLSAGKVVKVFIEPGTGRKFQSFKSVEMHLSQMDGSLVPTQTDFLPKNFNMLSSADLRELLQKKDMPNGAQSSRTARRGLSFHSTSKEVPFSDPRYDDILFKPSQNSGPFKNKVYEGMPSSSFNEAPAKIKWVFSRSSGEDRWSPYVGESMVPEPVQQQWSNLFVSTVDEEILMHRFRRYSLFRK